MPNKDRGRNFVDCWHGYIAGIRWEHEPHALLMSGKDTTADQLLLAFAQDVG